MTENNLMLSDQIAGYPHPKVTETMFGHDFSEQEFINCYKSGKLHHGWLITGAKGIGKATLAWRIAKFLLTQPIDRVQTSGFLDISDRNKTIELDEHLKNTIISKIMAESEPRLAVLRRSFDEKRKTFRSNIRVDEVRHLNNFFSLSVSDGGGRVAIIDCADDLNINAANALLKTLEEPPKNTVFLLISHNPQSLLQTIKSGPRAIYIDIFNDTLSDDAFPVVSSGFEKGNWRLTLTTMSFDKFCQTLAKSVFTSGFVNNYDDPFILILNLKTNKNFKCHNRIQETLFKYFKSRLLPSKFSYGRGDLLNTPMRELMVKVIVMTSGGYENSKLEEIVNFSLERDDFHKISYGSLVDEVSSYDNVKLNMDDVRTQMRDNLGLVVPQENSFFTRNYNPQNFFDTGCQMIAMNYQKVDKYMETYFTKFQGSSFVEKPKGLQSLA